VTIGVIAAPVHELLAGRCSACGTFPCVCRIDHTMRIEICACGGRIVVVDRSDWRAAAVAVGFHNTSTGHAHWAITLGLR
jgi:hypothetical protein